MAFKSDLAARRGLWFGQQNQAPTGKRQTFHVTFLLVAYKEPTNCTRGQQVISYSYNSFLPSHNLPSGSAMSNRTDHKIQQAVGIKYTEDSLASDRASEHAVCVLRHAGPT
eukprot:6488621-Amphidinium_carterae.2